MGISYVEAGRDPSLGIDCFGLVRLVYTDASIHISDPLEPGGADALFGVFRLLPPGETVRLGDAFQLLSMDQTQHLGVAAKGGVLHSRRDQGVILTPASRAGILRHYRLAVLCD